MSNRPAVTLALLTSVLLIFVATASAQTLWSPTATQGITLANATPLGALAASTPLHIGVSLQLRNRSALVALVKSMNDPTSPYYGTELSEAQFAQYYAPTSSQVSAVVNYLTAQGFSNITVEDNNQIVQADGTAAVVNAAFNTSIQEFLQNGATVYANTAPAQVPASLSGIALAVLGLNNAAKMQTPNRARTSDVPTYPFTAYYPQDLWKAYDVDKTPTGSKTAVAVIAEGDVTQVIKDFKTARKLENLPVPPVYVITAGLPSPDTAGADEWTLDTQASAGMAGTVSALYIYTATSMTDTDLTYAFNKWASKKLARAGNASFGLCEVFTFLDGNMATDDNIFLEAAAQGQTMFASTGDTGSFCGAVVGTNGVPAGAPFIESPSSSPYVVAVGGTTLLTNSDGTYNNEITWNAGGGGISQFEGPGYWQSGVVPSTAANSRGTPDVSMDADPNSGFQMYTNCTAQLDPTAACTPGWEVIGGTSLSSPLAMGVWARIQSAHNNKLGFASPHFYRGAALLQSSTPLGFHDIIVGNNGLYNATPGWDYTTGMGSFDVSLINKLIQ